MKIEDISKETRKAKSFFIAGVGWGIFSLMWILLGVWINFFEFSFFFLVFATAILWLFGIPALYKTWKEKNQIEKQFNEIYRDNL